MNLQYAHITKGREYHKADLSPCIVLEHWDNLKKMVVKIRHQKGSTKKERGGKQVEGGDEREK